MGMRIKRWGLLGLAVVGSGAVAAVLWPASVGANPVEEVPDELHCDVCGHHLLQLEQRYQLHNAVVSLDRRNRSDDDHNAYRNVVRLDTETGRAWVLRPNSNVAGFSWVLLPNYD